MCSNNDGSILAPIGSRIKSIPSLRANLAAGTKSESPAIRTATLTGGKLLFFVIGYNKKAQG